MAAAGVTAAPCRCGKNVENIFARGPSIGSNPCVKGGGRVVFLLLLLLLLRRESIFLQARDVI